MINFVKTAKSLLLKIAGKNYSIPTSDASVPEILDAIRAGATEDDIIDKVDVRRLILKEFDGTSFELDPETNGIYIDGELVHESVSRRLLEYSEASLSERVRSIVAFWRNVKLNPNPRAQTDLFKFLSHNNMPITEDGFVLCYKGSYRNNDGTYVDNYTKKMPNNPGDRPSMRREDVDSDPNVVCSRGIHAATQDYASGVGNCIMSVKVNPQFVCAIPTDYSNKKMRVCELLVLEEIERSYVHEQSIVKKGNEYVYSFDAAAFTEY